VTRRRGDDAAKVSRGADQTFDYAAPAELFMIRARSARRPPVNYRRFETAAEAIRFAIEEVPSPFLVGAVMEVREERFDHRGIRDLYDREAYPLARQ